MLTGDMKRVADQVAAELGIDEVHSELLPADKVAKVEELLAKKARKRNLHLSVMGSMMHRCFPEQISELPWELLDLMQPLKRPMWC